MFSLGRWSSRIQTGFLVPRPTRVNKYKVSFVFAYTTFTSFGAPFQALLLTKLNFLPYGLLTGSSSHGSLLDKSSMLPWSFIYSQPLLSIRLSTYLLELTSKNLKGLGSSHFARHYFGNRYLLSFPRPTKMFQFRRLPFNYPMDSGNDAYDMTRSGFPHSEISG